MELIDRHEVLSIIRMAMPEETSGSLLYQSVKQLPTVDAVEVVRCKDCKNWGRTWRRHPPDYHYCPFIDYMTSESFYCAKAERRTDATFN